MSLPQATTTLPERPPARQDLRQQAHQHLDLLLDACEHDPSSNLHPFEKTLLSGLLRLGTFLLQLFLLQRHHSLDLTPWFQCGYRLGERYATRTLETVFGSVRYGRVYLLPPRGKHGVHPLDAAVGLGRDCYSPLLIGYFTRLATRMSYNAATRMGAMFLGWAPSPTTVEDWVLGLGRPAYEYLSQGPLPEGDGEVLVIEVDGKAIPTATAEELARRRGPRGKHSKACSCKGCQRHRGRDKRKQRGSKKPRKPGDKSKNGKSATLVAMYTLKRGPDGRLHGPLNKKLYGSFSCRQSALQWARQQATRRGFPPGTKKVVQVVVDGEQCLESGIRDLFPDAILTLDIRHAQERLWQAGRQLHKAGSEELAVWVKPLEEQLYRGEVKSVLLMLREAHDGVSRRGPGTAQRRAELNEVIDYLKKRESMMAYGEQREKDLVIASGVVEGAARYLVGERLDNAGMRWIKERAECLLLLRCIEVNGDWDSFWDWAQQRRSKDLQQGKLVRLHSKTPTKTLQEHVSKKKKAEAA